jgi:hypothetical protein
MNPDQVLDHIIRANPKPAEAEAPSTVLTRAALLVELDRRSGDVQTRGKTLSQKTTQYQPVSQTDRPTGPPAGPSRRSRLVPALAGAAAVVVALVIGVLLLSSESDTAPAAPASVVVPGTEQWTDTGIDLNVGDTVLIEADGAVTPSLGNEDFYGPDGVPDRPSARVFNVEGLEEADHNSLIGRIGEAGAPFDVGSQLLWTADTDGRLFLGMNDWEVANNAGEFTATITVNP